MQGWGGSCRGGVGCEKFPLNNLICHKLGVLSFLLKHYFQLLSRIMWEKACFIW